MNSGVYIIKNITNGKVYVGSTRNFTRRFKSHKTGLSTGRHHSTKLQRAWDKHGESSFTFEKVLICEVKKLLVYEQIVLDFYKAATDGYNHLPKAGSREGAPHSQTTLAKMTEFQRSWRKKYDFNGRKLCIVELSEITGISQSILWRRIVCDKRSVEDAVKVPYESTRKKYHGFGERLSSKQWVEKIGCTESFLTRWLGKGLSIEECVAKHKAITRGEFARVSGVDSSMFISRIKNGWSVGDALAIPAKKLGEPHHIKRVLTAGLTEEHRRNISVGVTRARAEKKAEVYQ